MSNLERVPVTNGTPRKELQICLERLNGTHSRSNSPSPAKRGKMVEGMGKENVPETPREIVGRMQQFKILDKLFRGSGALPGSIFLYGAPSSGKSYTLEMALQDKDVHVIRIHCAEILCGRRAFYETIVKQLVSKTNLDLAPNFKCDSLQSLYSNFYDYLNDDTEEIRKLRVVVVIEGTENLRGEHDDILRFLVSLQDTTQALVCVTFISTLPPSQYMPNIMDHSIIPLHFPQYTMEELTQILCQQKTGPSGSITAKYYQFYIKMIVNVFYFACRDFRKLSRLAKNHWDKFEAMASKEGNQTRLWKTLEPELKAQFFELNSVKNSVHMGDQKRQDSFDKKLGMPLNAKYLLIASYLATHNPPSSDKRFFVKTKTAKKSRALAAAKSDVKPFARPFELNRLHAIFGSIQVYCDDQAVNRNRNISFNNLLATMCQNKLIQYVGEDSVGNTKYRCLLDYDAILEVSRSVNFELNNYLYRLI